MSHPAVEIDESNQRIYLTMDGSPSIEESAAIADACIEAAKQLDDGFDLVNDMRTFQPTDEEALKEVERGKRGLAEHGMAAAVRVVAESTTGQMQWDRAGENAEGYQVAKAESIADAETLLDKRAQEA